MTTPDDKRSMQHMETNHESLSMGIACEKNINCQVLPLNFLGEPARTGSYDGVYKLTRPKIITV